MAREQTRQNWAADLMQNFISSKHSLQSKRKARSEKDPIY